MKQEHAATLNDIKTLFDGVKNLGLCAAIAFGLQGFQPQMEKIGFTRGMRAFINILGIGLSIALTGFAIVWLCYSFNENPASKILFQAGRFTLGAVTLLVMIVIISSSWVSIPHIF